MKPAASSIQHQDNSLLIPQTKPLPYQDLSIQIQQLYTRTFSDVGSRFLHLLVAEIANITTCRSVFINQLLTFDEYKESELYRKEHNFDEDDRLMLIRAFYVDPKDGRIQ